MKQRIQFLKRTDLWNRIKFCCILVIGILDEEKKENGAKKNTAYEEIISKILNFKKTNNL